MFSGCYETDEDRQRRERDLLAKCDAGRNVAFRLAQVASDMAALLSESHGTESETAFWECLHELSNPAKN
jgi:hypothetical protein